jgi:hypothetical protein
MHPRTFPPLIEAFLIIDQPRQRLSYWTHSLAPLDDDRAPPLATITAYYDPSTDQALLALRYDELALGRDRLAFVIEIALLAEIGMIQPAELSDGDRRRFLNERLSRCTLHVSDQRGVVASLAELVRRVRDVKKVPPPVPAARAQVRPRGTTQDPVLLVNPKSTRDDLPQQEMTIELIPEDQVPTVYQRTSPHVIARAKSPHRAETVLMPPGQAIKIAESSRPGRPIADEPIGDEDATIARAESPMELASSARVDPDAYPMANGPTPPGIIYARYLRSGRWMPIRIGSLSLRRAALMSGVLPRLHDHVDVALSYGSHRALVRGPVTKVSTTEEVSLSGAATFSVNFELDDVSRRQLTSLLTAARAAQVTIKPPPPRQARRFVVEWPVTIGTIKGTVRAEALDVSRDGMFVRPIHTLTLDSMVTFSAVLDDGASPVTGRAKVVRQIREPEARTCGLAPGYGLLIADMGEADLDRWTQFLTRIEKRADKRVLIGAAPERLTELQSALAALGYAVTGGTDPGALVQLAGVERPVDAVLIDGGWLAPGNSISWIESLFSARNVPCVTMHGDVRRGRAAIDKLLAVA